MSLWCFSSVMFLGGLAANVCGFTNALIHLLSWAGEGRAQSALEIYQNSLAISLLGYPEIHLAINTCISDLILNKKCVLFTKMSSYKTLNKFLQNDHISNLGSMYPGERCLTVGGKEKSFPTQHFQSWNSKRRKQDIIKGVH